MKQKTIMAFVVAFAAIGMATIPLTQTAQAQGSLPDWIKTNAGWWAEGAVDDATFLNGIEFLVENGIINVSSDSKSVDVDTLTIGFIPVEKADELTPKAEALENSLKSRIRC